jgi:hypothetical protein
MLFSMKERLLLSGILAKRPGNLVTIRLIHEMQMALAPSDEEAVALDIRFEDGVTRWNADATQPKELDLGEASLGIIVASLRELNERNELTLDLLDLYERFVENKAEPTEEAKS